LLAKDESDFAKYLSHRGLLADAADHYQKSADYYDMEDYPASRDAALIPLASIQASLGNYMDAALLFEKVAKSCSEDKLRVFGIRTHLLNALLCRLASGQSVKDVINYDTYHGWMHSEEWKFQYALLAIMEGGLEVNIEIVASPYARSLNLNDPWKKALFDKISSLYPPKNASASSSSSTVSSDATPFHSTTSKPANT
jgi:alpha-soluble NSF attachment protein